jgi:hypothetical protein
MHETLAPDTSKHAPLPVSLQPVASGVHGLDIKQDVPWTSQMCRRRAQSCSLSLFLAHKLTSSVSGTNPST